MPTDAMGDRQSALFDLIVLLRTLNLGYHHAHVNTKGRAYYGDHLLLQRLYTGNGGPNPITEIDGLMEQWKRLYPQSMLDPAAMAVAVAHAAQPLARKSGEAAMRALLEMERTLERRIANVLKSWPGEDAGLDNFLQGIADQHATNIYLLQQRLANGTAHIAPEPPVTAGPQGEFLQYSLEQLHEALLDLPADAPRLREQIEAEIARREAAAPVWIIRYRYVEPQPTGPFTGHMESPEPRKKGDIIPAMFGRARVISSSRKRAPREQTTQGPTPPRYPEMAELAEKINAHLAAGGHVQVTTYTKSWLYGPKHAGWFGTDKTGNLTVQAGRRRDALSIAGKPSVGIRFSRLPTTQGPDEPFGSAITFGDDVPVPGQSGFIDNPVTAANARRLANLLVQHGPTRVENVIEHFTGMYQKQELAGALRLLGQSALPTWPRQRLIEAIRAWAEGRSSMPYADEGG